MNTDKAASIFWLCISAVVSVASFRLGLGKLSTPGSGFMPFGASVLLGILSIVCFLQAQGRTEPAEARPLFRGMLWPRVILVFIALFAYARLIPFGGYRVTTFFLLAFLFGIAGQKKAWKVALYSLITTALSYYVFSKWLNLQFPVGPLGF
jgi:putative tricarboxylic transport membrane protein